MSLGKTPTPVTGERYRTPVTGGAGLGFTTQHFFPLRAARNGAGAVGARVP